MNIAKLSQFTAGKLRRLLSPLLLVPVLFFGTASNGVFFSSNAFAAGLKYNLNPTDLGGGCYALIGSEGYFDIRNGGYIVNVGFIVTNDGVIVVDTGPSVRFGQQYREFIDETSGHLPIDRVIITHGHPDHYLGNQAFADTPIHAGRGTVEMITQMGGDFAVNMYRLSGDWMRGTESIPPDTILEPGSFELGGHKITVFEFQGHTDNDIVVLDETCGVLYAGDLVFNHRTLSVPHAKIPDWLESLEQLQSISFSTIVSGHGKISHDLSPIQETADYLTWLSKTLQDSFDFGLDITEVMELNIPERFADYALAEDEFKRSVHSLYPRIEAENFPLINQ